jgi:hypothetical protein
MVNGGSLARNSNEEIPQETAEDAASYLFDLLVAARRLAVTRRHKFLAYLIGMAAEEARLLTQGRSAVRSGPSKAAG